MAFFIHDISDTHQFHRMALLKAADHVNKTETPFPDMTIIVSTRNMIKTMFTMALTRTKTVIALTGFGRLYSDYGVLGRMIFLAVVKFCHLTSARAFLVENDTDLVILKKLGISACFKTHGSGLSANMFTRNKAKSTKQMRLGYLSRFHHSKGSHEILKAAQNLPADREMIIAGWDIKGSTYKDQFTAIAKNKDNVVYIGKLKSREEVSAFYNSIDVFLSPSVREGGNISLQEAIWHKVPFVTTVAPGCDTLAETFDCPMVEMDAFAEFITGEEITTLAPDLSDWPERISPYLTENVTKEMTAILTTISRL